MKNKIAVIDYDSDWALTERNLHPRTTPGYLTREQVIDFYGTLGVEGVELFHGYWEDYTPTRLKGLLADAGLTPTGYLSFVDLAVPPAERRSAVDRVAAILERAAEIGAGVVHNVPFVLKEGVPFATQKAWVIDGLQECAQRARTFGMTLVCENLDADPWRRLTGRAADALDLWRKVGHPSFQMIYDAGNSLLVDENSVEALRIMAPSVVYIHLKNYRLLKPGEDRQRFLEKDDGSRVGGVLLDAGDAAIPPVVAELNRMNYQGWIVIEYQGEDDPRDALKHNIKYLRGLMKSVASR